MSSPRPHAADPLEGVERTSEDAQNGKIAAINAGYYEDPFVKAFVPVLGPNPGPLINRGHYLRVAAVGSLCEQFLDTVPLQLAQIISLGAGFDTRFWQLSASGRRPRLYVELDRPAVTSHASKWTGVPCRCTWRGLLCVPGTLPDSRRSLYAVSSS